MITKEVKAVSDDCMTGFVKRYEFFIHTSRV